MARPFAFLIAALIGVSLSAGAAEAQSQPRSYSYVSPGCGQPGYSCTWSGDSASGRHAYERWQDGTPARARPRQEPSLPQFFRGYNSIYGYGR